MLAKQWSKQSWPPICLFSAGISAKCLLCLVNGKRQLAMTLNMFAVIAGVVIFIYYVVCKISLGESFYTLLRKFIYFYSL